VQLSRAYSALRRTTILELQLVQMPRAKVRKLFEIPDLLDEKTPTVGACSE
jgi:hypothetical protein